LVIRKQRFCRYLIIKGHGRQASQSRQREVLKMWESPEDKATVKMEQIYDPCELQSCCIERSY